MDYLASCLRECGLVLPQLRGLLGGKKHMLVIENYGKQIDCNSKLTSTELRSEIQYHWF